MIRGPVPGLRAIRSWPRRLRLVVWSAAMGLAALAFFVAFVSGFTAPPRGAALGERARALERWFTGEVAIARAAARETLERDQPVVPRGARLARRLEGVGRLDEERHYLTWRGIPPEPSAALLTSEKAAFEAHVDGVHTRLVMHLAPEDGRPDALASWIIDSRLEEQAFARLIPRSLLRGVQLEVAFLDSRTPASAPAPGGPALDASDAAHLVLRAPDGTLLGRGTLAVPDAARAAERERRQALAWLVVLGIVLGAVLFRGSGASGAPDALVRTLAALALARGALVLVQAPVLLLPRELGSASLYGTSGLLALAASPADLALTALAAWAAAGALRRFTSGSAASRAVRVALAAAGALAALAAFGGLLLVVARDSRVPLLEPPGPWSDGARLALASALALAALAAAELSTQTAALVTRTERRPSRLAVAGALCALLLAGGLALRQREQALGLERLRSELLPLVLEQHARRAVALGAALRSVAQRVEAGEALPEPGPREDAAAYDYWVGSELFFAGYQSSLAFYDAQGRPVGHFGFDLPSLDEKPEESDAAHGGARSWEEPFEPVPALRRSLLHAQAPLRQAGRLVGTVVGHVVDEPDNLPFLPGVRTYLAALGPATAHASMGLPAGGAHYVVYDAPGTVLLSTLPQPPAMADALVQSFENDSAVDLRVAGERLVGFAAQDELHRLHALLLPTPSPLQRSAAAMRLVLLGLGWVALIAVVPRLSDLGAARALVRTVRGSFYRKLLLALLAASIVPLVGLALLLRGTIAERGRESLEEAATRFAAAAQRVLDDYAATALESDVDWATLLDDDIVDWLRNVVGQEILVYENGLLQATSTRELFASGLLPPRLDGEVHRRLGREGLPFLVAPSRLGSTPISVAYAPVQGPDPLRELVVAVPLVAEREEIERATARVGDMILLSTVLLASLLAFVAAAVARNVARPVRELVGATGRIAAGDYDTRLAAHSRDEVAELVAGFNSMAAALGSQRADLERRREYIERLLQHATTGVLSVDARGVVVTLNPAARELLSSGGRHLAVGEPLVEFLGRSAELSPLAGPLASPQAGAGEPAEVDLEREGKPRRLRVVAVELPEPGGGSVGRLVLLDDVTDLMRSNQLAAWAEMARAIAHEIKNPLTPIQLSTEHLRRLLRDRGVLPDADVETCLETVIKQVRTLYEIAGEFSAYAKLPTLEPRPADAVAFMRAAVGPYRSAPPPGVTIEERYVDGGRAAIDGRVLGRAVVNLVENALQAMPGGGVLRIGVDTDAARDEVVLSVADSGTGLSAEARRRLFEPYFSTKSSGTGLGLAIVRRAVEAHHGRVEVETRVGRGTTFSIRLPRLA